jgi:uncharacterized paraquat-inducible protein A
MGAMTFCYRCDYFVSFEEVSAGYFCVCPYCDEDLFSFETYTEKARVN